MAANRAEKRPNAFDDNQTGAYMRMGPVSCMAEGCPMRVQLLTNPDRGEGLCGFHAFADAKLWGRITSVLREPACRSLIKAIDALEHNLAAKPDTVAMLERKVQDAAMAFGFEKEDVRLKTLSGLENGALVQFVEPPRVFAYRMSSELHQRAILRAQMRPGDPFVTNAQRGQAWTAIALDRIAGRGRELMDGPAGNAPAQEAA